MSSILKALKKLEDEKTVRKPDSLNIDTEILRGDSSSRFSPVGIFIVAALIFVCGVGATYVYMKNGLSGQPAPQTAIAPPTAPSPALLPPQKGTVTPEPVRHVQPPAARPHQQTAASSAPSLTPAKQPVARQHPKAPSAQTSKPVAAVRPTKSAQQGGGTAVRTAAPVIKVNGIAFQDGSSDSMAVVNGIPVSNGSVVEGARVEDIQRDRVRFSYGGERFEVTLGKTNR